MVGRKAGFLPAELCGWLLAVMAQRANKPELREAMRERGLLHFSARSK